MEGSSSSSNRGRPISARAIASICCSPPDIVPASCLERSRSRGNSVNMYSISAAISTTARVASVRENAPICRFSITLMRAKTPRPSGTRANPRRTSVWVGIPRIDSPNSSICPPQAKSPVRALSVVVLPAPLAPISVTSSPGLTSKSIPLTA